MVQLAALALAASLSLVGDHQAPPPQTAKPQTAKPVPQAPPRKVTPKPVPAAPAATAPKPEPPPPPPPATDVRMKTASTQGAQVSQNTTYLRGPRQRVEFPGVVILDQCDLKRSVMLNTAAKRYRAQPYEIAAPAPPAETSASAAPQMAQARGGVVTVTTTLTDTLERQPMFGLEARHIKSLVIKQSSDKACDKTPLKIEVDAWYADLPARSGCTKPVAAPAPAAAPDANACIDRVETKVTGDVKLGFPIKTVTVTTTGEGDKQVASTSSEEVTELEITRLDAALFDVPADFVEANSTAEVVPALAKGGSLADALFGSTAEGTSTAAPKKPGTTRIGVLEPINRTDRDLPSSSLRRDLVAKFNKAPYEAIPIAGSSASAIEQDAVRLQCDYLMLTEIVEAKTSKPGKLGGVMKVTGSAPKDSQDVKLDYKLFAVGATQSAKFSGSAKASNGGFGVGSALHLAAFAGQMYLGLMMGGGMGMGMMNPMAAVSGMGGLGPAGAGFFDPRSAAITSMLGGGKGGMLSAIAGGLSGVSGVADPSDAAMRDTVSEALGNSAKSAIEQLGKKK